MKSTNSQPVYGPEEWDIDFSFDLDLKLSDYLLIAGYLLFVVPVALLVTLVATAYSRLTGLLRGERDEAAQQKANLGLVSMISKLF